MQDLCQITPYIRMSSSPTGDILIKFFPHSLFGDVFFHVLFYYFCVLFVCFDLCVFLLYCIVFVCIFLT